MSIFSPPKQPQNIPPPAAPVALPTKADPKVGATRKKEKQIAALAAGRDSTVLTQGLGLTGAAPSSAGKALLGA